MVNISMLTAQYNIIEEDLLHDLTAAVAEYIDEKGT